eukprot:14495664-Alexandrium_andersonii.AAC.1
MPHQPTRQQARDLEPLKLEPALRTRSVRQGAASADLLVRPPETRWRQHTALPAFVIALRDDPEFRAAVPD